MVPAQVSLRLCRLAVGVGAGALLKIGILYIYKTVSALKGPRISKNVDNQSCVFSFLVQEVLPVLKYISVNMRQKKLRGDANYGAVEMQIS